MSILIPLSRFGYRQSRNLFRLILGRNISYPSLGSMTLDQDDVDLARSLLKNKEAWYRKDEVDDFHRVFASWNGSSHVFSFMAGRVALSAAIYAMDLHKGDEVILPGYTCVVVPNAFHYAGISTVYCDIELDTYGLDASQLEAKITSKTRCILLHHLYGIVCRDYESIINIAKKHGLYVIEDCAQSTGAEYKGIKVGNIGDFGIYSSEQSKIYNTVQGGIVVTNDSLLAKKIQEYYDNAAFPSDDWIYKQLYTLIVSFYRNKHRNNVLIGDLYWLRYQNKLLISTTKQEERGIQPPYYHRKMPAVIASIGINQLKKVDYYNRLRKRHAQLWDDWCAHNHYKAPVILSDSNPVYLRYPIIVEPEKKQNLSWATKSLKVLPGVWYKTHIHPTPITVSGCSMADKAVLQCINFPTLFPTNFQLENLIKANKLSDSKRKTS